MATPARVRGRPRTKPAELRREELLDAAQRLFVEKGIAATSIDGRIGTLTQIAAGALALPGSIGTAAELMIAWNINHIARVHGGTRFPTAAIGDGWKRLWLVLTEDLGASPSDIVCFTTVAEGINWLLAQPELGVA